ncbi:H+ Antiporter protein [Dermatophilus congolensis]|uniref:H+ Antiporter protein n=1 Tax=Dermatophilus congolensis TaxID=1863 RepID=A0A239V5C3_9MICO|nr:MFS transporter [Dermatophilus congolensis]SNV16544.1 H+ Antiporter protein [Dermatophilus congolensis]
MLRVLTHRTYAKLFSAHVIALVGTGLLTVALGLLAFDIGGGNAGLIMGTAMTIKMGAYVFVSPIATAFVSRLPRKPVLIGAEITRAAVALCLPFVTEAWQIYILIFLLQSASAAFTPTFSATIPAVLPDENEYTQALSLSRLAYDLESLISPILAAALLTITGFHNLFFGTFVGFIASAGLVITTHIPATAPSSIEKFHDRLTHGWRLFWSTAELRGLIGMNLVVAAVTPLVIVNTVVLVRAELGRPQHDVAVLLAAYGGGSMLIALSIPKLINRLTDRSIMLAGGISLLLLLIAAADAIAWTTHSAQWGALLLVWTLMGAATSAVLTPSARILRRNSTDENRAAVFAAQFSLSHACFLFTYPLAGALGTGAGVSTTALTLVPLGLIGVLTAAGMWMSSSVAKLAAS